MNDPQTTTTGRVLAVLQRVSKSADTATPDSHLVNDLGFDSLQTLEFVAELEDEFGIYIPLNGVPDITTVGEVSTRIVSLMEEQGRV